MNAEIVRKCILGIRMMYANSLTVPITDSTSEALLHTSSTSIPGNLNQVDTDTDTHDNAKDDCVVDVVDDVETINETYTLHSFLNGRVSKYIEVESLLSALRVVAMNPDDVNRLLVKYLMKKHWHFN